MKSLVLEDHEALVLLDFLRREIDINKERRLAPLIDHPAEFWALNVVLTRVESLLSEPFRHEYETLVDGARAKIMEECDPEGTYQLGAHE
jgi:hypothetical protein